MNNYRQEVRRKYKQDNTPCDGCVHVAKCGENKLACNAFALFVDTGITSWSITRKPTHNKYIRVMFMDDKALSREVIAEHRKSLRPEEIKFKPRLWENV